MFIALIAGLVLMFMILIVSFTRSASRLPARYCAALPHRRSRRARAHGQPISFSSLLGVIALGGIIINHAIILMDSMLHHLAEEPGKPLIDTVVDSAATRLRPIVLTTIATVIAWCRSPCRTLPGARRASHLVRACFRDRAYARAVPVLFYRARIQNRSAEAFKESLRVCTGGARSS